MAALTEIPSFSSKSWENREEEEEEEEENHTGTVLDVFQGKMTENLVLQKLIVASQLPGQAGDREAVGAHFEKVHFQLSKDFELDHMTGLLLIYPSCVLHIIESSREVLLRVLKDLKDLQQHPTRSGATRSLCRGEELLAARGHNTHSLHHLVKVIGAGQTLQALEEEENTESLVCTVLSALQELETTKHIPESWEFILSQELVLKLLGRDDLLSPEEHLQTFDSPLNIRVDFGQVSRSQFINRV